MKPHIFSPYFQIRFGIVDPSLAPSPRKRPDGDMGRNEVIRFPFLPARALLAGVCLLAFLALQTSSAQTNLQKIASFGIGGLTGSNSFGALIEAADGRLYGTTQFGGTSGGSTGGGGIVFALNKNGTGATVLHNFGVGFETNAVDGIYPEGALLEAGDGMLYGTTPSGTGGSFNRGTIFRLNVNGFNYETIFIFTNTLATTQGRIPGPYIVEDVNGLLYGTTKSGGANSVGTAYRMQKSGSGFAALLSLDGADVAFAYSDLMASADGMLYGTSYNGGVDDSGALFKYSTNGTGFSVLRQFTGSLFEGSESYVTEGSDGKLYGTVFDYNGGLGSVFSVLKTGASYTTLHSFTGAPTDGAYPKGVIEGTNGMLYGVTSGGGGNSVGTIFKLNKDGTAYSILHQFKNTGSDGINPVSKLLQASDGAFYGKTFRGGDAGWGTIYRLSDSAPVVEESPTLAIVPATPGNATISWTPDTGTNWVLQQTAVLSPPNWTNSPSIYTNPIVVPTSLQTKFYRLLKP